jgi:hypothetical protein
MAVCIFTYDHKFGWAYNFMGKNVLNFYSHIQLQILRILIPFLIDSWQDLSNVFMLRIVYVKIKEEISWGQ